VKQAAMEYRIADNHRSSNDENVYLDESSPLRTKIAGKTLSTLLQESKDESLLIFPYALKGKGQSIDLENDSTIIDIGANGCILTNNIMGFIGVGDEQLVIHSRFSPNDEKDLFLHYMLQRTFHINVVDLKIGNSEDQYYDLIKYLFPSYLNKALSKGLLREYVRKEFNDSNIKGPIDVARHLRENTPFLGKVAYSIREYSSQNPMIQLVRHTIEYIRADRFCAALLTNDTVTRQNVQVIETATTDYKLQDRQKVIRQNLKPVRHPYFHEYRELQRLCLMILRHNKHSVGQNEDKLHGILFDGAWLWEEYMNVVLRERFGERLIHPDNRQEINKQKYFKEGGEIYPDFIIKTEPNVTIADAKYKHIKGSGGDDYHQLLGYMFRFDSRCGFILSPYDPDSESESIKPLHLLEGLGNKAKSRSVGQDVVLTKLGLEIPRGRNDMIAFQSAIKESEQQMTEAIEINCR
jgi:5-methylcytosine-specific restriction endonuclease McrBC regulatory subunit McrC